MNTADIQNAIIKRIKAHTGRPIIQADQGGGIPDGPHAVFKFIVPYAKGVGLPAMRVESTADEFRRIQSEVYTVTLSITAVSDWDDGDTAVTLAQSIRDWFDFYGYDSLSAAGLVVSMLGDIGNRDSVNDDEARAGFDVIMRVPRELVMAVGWIETAEITQE